MRDDPVRVKDVIHASKVEVHCNEWQSGPAPKSTFPLGKAGKHSMRIRGGYEWICLTFKALSFDFRVVIAVHFDKQQYYAYLGRSLGTDTQMLVSYEYHATHRGWHAHAGCGDTANIPIGRYMGPWRNRLSSRYIDWDISDRAAALNRACKVFRITLSEGTTRTGQMPLL